MPKTKGISRTQKETAKDSIAQYFKLADKAPLNLANRYVTLARKIAMKYRIRMPIPLKRKFCKHCYCYLKSGVNVRIRLNKGKKVYYCMSCKKFTRIPY